ncbi:MAG TPA: DUF4402 domain-containing protein [Croceibacterium sp.]
MLRPKTGGAHALRAALFAVLAAAALLPQQASAQSRTAIAKESAIVLTAGSIVKLTDLTFGNIIPSGGGGTVVLTPSASATCTTPATLVHSGACTAATFAIRGKRNQRVRIRDGAAAITLTGPGGATMTVDTFTDAVTGMTASNGGNGWNFGNWLITDPSGNAGFWVGGTLHVAANQAPGVYNGTLLIQIQFN